MLSLRPSRVLSLAIVLGALAPLSVAQFGGALALPEYPAENPPNAAQEMLGKLLFWEEQLSYGNGMACGTCHITEAGGSDPRSFGTINPGADGEFGTADDVRGSRGVVRMSEGGEFRGDTLFGHGFQVTGRKSPSAINAFSFKELFWDGRALEAFISVDDGQVAAASNGALESQAAGPPLSDVEMTRGGESWDSIEARLAKVAPLALATDVPASMQAFVDQYDKYPAMFEAAYGDPAITGDRILFAIANYERTLVSNQTPLDAWLATGVIAPELQTGLEVYSSVGCATCHPFPETTDGLYHNIGVRPDDEDVGRMAVTGEAADIAQFKTPSLRNVGLRLPLMHNGGKDTLAEVVDFYDIGGDFPGPNTDSFLIPIFMSPEEKAALVIFLDEGLTDPRVAARQAPFDRPTLRGELPPLNTVFGVAGVNGQGVPPALIEHLPANTGNPAWLLGLADATPNAPAVLALSSAPAGGSPLPDPRHPIAMNIDLGQLFLLAPALTDGFGYATFKIGVPAAASLQGLRFYGQWFIQDAAVQVTGGFYGSEGVAVEIF